MSNSDRESMTTHVDVQALRDLERLIDMQVTYIEKVYPTASQLDRTPIMRALSGYRKRLLGVIAAAEREQPKAECAVKVDESTVREWIERHDLGGCGSYSDMFCAFTDAMSFRPGQLVQPDHIADAGKMIAEREQPKDGSDVMKTSIYELLAGVDALDQSSAKNLAVEQLIADGWMWADGKWVKPAAAVPDGWLLAPIDPTPDQRLASKRYKAACNKKRVSTTGPGYWRAMIEPLIDAKE